MRYHVETYISGRAYKDRDFATLEEAKAYQADLHRFHYFVPITEGDEAEKARRQNAASRAFHDRSATLDGTAFYEVSTYGAEARRRAAQRA